MPETTHAALFKFHGLGLDDEELELPAGTSFETVLREREIHPETVLVFCNDEVVPAESEVPPGADVRVLHIVSGGSR
ncbi:MAG: MoaD/ThiS family protein [Candidatus Thermoplasmatota archaeon]|nr:MoaD/ThiS family protein [Candidatus Thermoplasmatota archaeon]